jgi:hypothetical protein
MLVVALVVALVAALVVVQHLQQPLVPLVLCAAALVVVYKVRLSATLRACPDRHV